MALLFPEELGHVKSQMVAISMAVSEGDWSLSPVLFFFPILFFDFKERTSCQRNELLLHSEAMGKWK